MRYCLENETLRVEIDTHGAEIKSVVRKEDDTEYMWNGDPKYWGRTSPVLFPFVGAVRDKEYRHEGKTYAMGQHGFARDAEFTCIEETTGSITNKLVYSDETLEIYPFEFELLITHRFDAENPRLLHVTWAVKNLGSDEMLYSIGGHPGFRVPLTGSTGFEDYKLCFSQPCLPDRIGFTGDCYLNGQTECFPLEDDTTIRLRHELFDEDAKDNE